MSHAGISVTIDTNTFSIDCPCRWSKEMKCPCVHAMAIIIQKGCNPHDHRWFGRQYWTSNQLRVYSGKPPDISTFGNLYLTNLLPPEYKKTAGRPKLRRERSIMRDEGRSERICGTFGGKTIIKNMSTSIHRI